LNDISDNEVSIPTEADKETSPDTCIPTIPSVSMSHISNSEGKISEDNKSLSKEEVNEPDDDKDFHKGEEEYNFGRVFSDNNNEDDKNFSDDVSFYGFSDDDDEGYYYDLNTGETYKKSESFNLSILM
ncbi:2087_t:CDS:1, partial [Paraglomus occultum]